MLRQGVDFLLHGHITLEESSYSLKSLKVSYPETPMNHVGASYPGGTMRNFGLLGLILLTQWGCQCCGVTEWYQDKIDHIADHNCNMDGCYRPWLDLTQIKRCGDHGCQPMVSGCRPRLCESQTTSSTSTIAKVADDQEPSPVPQTEQVLQTGQEPESIDEIQWIHFEPLPAIETPKVAKQELPMAQPITDSQESEIEDVKIFEAPKPAFEPKMAAPLSVRPNPFLK